MTEPTKLPTTFVDAEGDTWTLRLTPPLIKAVRETHAVDLVNLGNAAWLQRMAVDVVLWADVLWTLCEREAVDRRKLTLETFAERIDGDTLDRALTALEGAILDFFPTRQRPAIAAALAKLDEAFANQRETALTLINETDVTVNKTDARLAYESMLSDFATSSPDGLASTPADSPSENLTG